MTRRDFVMASAVAAGSITRLRSQQSYPPEKLARIAILSLNFSSIMKTPAHPDDPKRTLDFMDFPDMIAERYGVHWVEPFADTALCFHQRTPYLQGVPRPGEEGEVTDQPDQRGRTQLDHV